MEENRKVCKLVDEVFENVPCMGDYEEDFLRVEELQQCNDKITVIHCMGLCEDGQYRWSVKIKATGERTYMTEQEIKDTNN
jgi:hypothetical protein